VADLFQGVGGVIIGVLLTWLGALVWKRWRVRASEIDTTQAQDKADRELLEAVYSVLITSDPTPLNPHPNPGVVDQLEQIRAEQQNVALELAEHRAEVTAKLEEDQTHVKALLEQHAQADAENFAAIRSAIEGLAKP